MHVNHTVLREGPEIHIDDPLCILSSSRPFRLRCGYRHCAYQDRSRPDIAELALRVVIADGPAPVRRGDRIVNLRLLPHDHHPFQPPLESGSWIDPHRVG